VTEQIASSPSARGPSDNPWLGHMFIQYGLVSESYSCRPSSGTLCAASHTSTVDNWRSQDQGDWQ